VFIKGMRLSIVFAPDVLLLLQMKKKQRLHGTHAANATDRRLTK